MSQPRRSEHQKFGPAVRRQRGIGERKKGTVIEENGRREPRKVTHQCKPVRVLVGTPIGEGREFHKKAGKNAYASGGTLVRGEK